MARTPAVGRPWTVNCWFSVSGAVCQCLGGVAHQVDEVALEVSEEVSARLGEEHEFQDLPRDRD